MPAYSFCDSPDEKALKFVKRFEALIPGSRKKITPKKGELWQTAFGEGFNTVTQVQLGVVSTMFNTDNLRRESLPY